MATSDLEPLILISSGFLFFEMSSIQSKSIRPPSLRGKSTTFVNTFVQGFTSARLQNKLSVEGRCEDNETIWMNNEMMILLA